MRKRKTISKSTRFNVFNRDGFRCRYCGKTSETVTLVVDHIIAVANGGTDDEANLGTSCEDCNQGKSAKVLGEDPGSESARLALLQRAREQIAQAEAAIEVSKAEARFDDLLLEQWCEITGRNKVEASTFRVVSSYAREYGMSLVLHWIKLAAKKCNGDKQMGRYISGCRRKDRDEGKIQ